MAFLPKRPLDFDRFAKSEEAKKLLAEETVKHWSKIFGWDKNQSAGSSSTIRSAKRSRSKK